MVSVLTSVVLIFGCNDTRITKQVLLDIIEEVNQQLGCFELRDYVLNSHERIVRFEVVMTYYNKVDMLTKFAWLMAQEYVFWLEDADFEMDKESSQFKIQGSVVNNPIIGDGNTISTTVTNSVTTTKVKRKFWGF